MAATPFPGSLTDPEELANAVTHGVGTGLAIAGLIALLVPAVLQGDPWQVLGAAVFGGTLVFLYLASTLYHSVQVQPAKSIFHVMDHVGIAFLIAGTYTPVILVKMRDTQGLFFLALIWILALVTATFKAFFTGRYTRISTMLYAAMGWLSLFLLKAMAMAMGLGGLLWIAAGGLSYTLGIVPFLWERLPFNHAVWHLFVIGGSACHFVAVLRYVMS